MNLRTWRAFSKRNNNPQQRQRDSLGEEVENQVLAYVRLYLKVSTCHIGKENGISHTKFHMI